MSEEKLYAVKNDEGEFLSFSDDGDSVWDKAVGNFETDKQKARSWAHHRGGHIVMFVEEPEKVVLTKEQAEIVEKARVSDFPASYISSRLLMNAYVNGYTVAKEKKYLVYKELGGKQKNKLFAQAYRSSIYPGTISWILTNEVKSGSWAQFTESEIEHYGLQDCEKEEVTDDDD
ncbi:DUF1642 domain-containing protein [Lacticaseibacillus paracasei]|uniref:DUF1642 domain-containing protein n=1 Tax=Lacticaseibacillus paracasei TaxID=1597 RepID=UPI0031D67846